MEKVVGGSVFSHVLHLQQEATVVSIRTSHQSSLFLRFNLPKR